MNVEQTFNDYQILVKNKNDEHALAHILESNPNFINLKGETTDIPRIKHDLLLCAVYDSNNLIAVQLVKHGWDPTVSYSQSELPILLALNSGNTELFLKLLDIVADSSYFCLSANIIASMSLSFAAHKGNTDVILRLLEFKPNLDYRGKNNPMTALMNAVRGLHLDLVNLLIKEGASLDIVGERGNTALTLALENAGLYSIMPKIIKLLVDSGANKKVKSKSYKSYKTYLGEALSSVVWHSSDNNDIEDNFWPLIELGAPVDWIYNQNGETILFQAVELRKLSLVAKLLDAGADINHQNKSKFVTPLMHAIKTFMHTKDPSYWPIMNLLIERKAIKTIKCKDGRTFLNHADSILGAAVQYSILANIKPSIAVGANIKRCALFYGVHLLIVAYKNRNLQVANELIQFMSFRSIVKLDIVNKGNASASISADTKLKFAKLLRGHLYHLAGLMLFRAFPRDIARTIYCLI